MGTLYVAAPGLSSFDAIYKVNQFGEVSNFYRGLGRPQGLAFDQDNNLYIVACLQGRRGIIKISADKKAELFLAGMNLIGFCFNQKGEMITATNDSVYRLPMKILGNLLN